MRSKILVVTLGAGLVLAATAPGHAQTPASKPAQAAAAPDAAARQADLEKLIELVRKDVRADKADIVAKTMKLEASQAAAFWPVYKAYEAEQKTLGDQRLAVIQDLAEHFDSLNDTKAKGLLDRSLAIEEQRVALSRKYAAEFLKVVPAKVVARFFQVDSRINNLINLEISSAIPLVD